MADNKYQLLDSGNLQKLELIDGYRLVRPSAQAVWTPRLNASEWKKADAVFERSTGGVGKWTTNSKRPKNWAINAPFGRFNVKLTDFGHIGIFPEQNANWRKISELIENRHNRTTQIKVLNLFAYTGGSTLAVAKAGAEVVHLDASKTSVAWARDNAKASDLEDLPVRWIVEDVKKFVEREVRRKSKYHGIILDPPSYGRGPKGQVWKIEEDLPKLLIDLKKILIPDLCFVLLSAHSAGYTPIALKNLLMSTFGSEGKKFTAKEMLVKETDSERYLPSGASCLLAKEVRGRR